MVEISFLGGVRSVTGSKFHIKSDQSRILLECGLYQGLKELRLRNWDSLPVDPRELDCIVISHAHLDHCGYLPRLVKAGFSGSIHMTEDTARLASIILLDSAKMQVEDADYASRKGYSKHAKPQPLYDYLDAERAISLFRPHPFHTPVQITGDARLTFLRAGHILGSSIVDLEVEGKRIIFSGDLGRPNHPILANPDPIPDFEIAALLLESTYGDRRHQSTSHELSTIINRTTSRGGSILIPAFAVDRTEVILHRLKELMDLNEIPRLPIYVDSPMALASLEIYRNAFERKAMDIDPKIKIDGDPFDEHFYQAARSVDESKAIAKLKNPSIIVSASGMATGGRVVHHLARMLPDSRDTVILVGYQSLGTRGRSLADGAKSLKMHGKVVKVLAEITKVGEFSVHADSREMIDWLRTVKKKPRKVFIVHGESDAGASFQKNLNQELSWDSTIPEHGSTHEI